jgi:hypothetical protein
MTVSSTNVAGKSGYLTCRKLKLDTCLSPCTSISSKWIKDLNIRLETLQLVQERTGNTLETICISKDFFSRTPAVQQLRERMDKWDYMKLKTICKTKEMVSKLKRPPTEWFIASYTPDKGLINRIYRELKKLNYPKINEPIKKWATVLNRTFSKEEVAKKTHEKMLTISGHKGNANQNHIKIPPYSYEKSYHQEHHQQQMLVRFQGKRNPHTLLVGM